MCRAVSPDEPPVGVWIRYTVHKRPGQKLKGSVRCTALTPGGGSRSCTSSTTEQLRAPSGSWIAIGVERAGTGEAQGSCGEARWSLSFDSREPELRHLAPNVLYRLPGAAHEAHDPAPAAVSTALLELRGRRTLELRGLVGNGRSQLGERARRALDLVHGVDSRGSRALGSMSP